MADTIPYQDGLGSEIARLHAQLQALATTPAAGNQSISQGALAILDASNRAQVEIGQYLWPTTPWLNNVIYGVISFDGSGHPIVVMGIQPDGLYGVGIYDTTGVRHVMLGQQTGGLSGLGVLNSAGTFQQVAGAISAAGAVLNTSSTTAVAISGASLTATIGPSGNALVSLSCQIQTNVIGDEADCDLYIDGSSAAYGLTLATNGTGLLALAKSSVIGGLSAASHTFELRGRMGGGSTGPVGFGNATITVQPL